MNATERGTLELLAAEVGRRVGGDLPPGIGFALLVFDFGGKGNLAYVSNAERSSMVEAMREFIRKNEDGPVRSVSDGRKS